MKTLISCILFLFSVNPQANSQSRKEFEQKVIQLTSENQKIMSEVLTLKKEILDLKEELSEQKSDNEKLQSQINSLTKGNIPNDSQGFMGGSTTKDQPSTDLIQGGRCQAITNAGSQCSRKADKESNYWWQHKSTYEPTRQQKVSSSNSGTSTYNGRTIHTGPRGGKYYINKNGNKTYIKGD